MKKGVQTLPNNNKLTGFYGLYIYIYIIRLNVIIIVNFKNITLSFTLVN